MNNNNLVLLFSNIVKMNSRKAITLFLIIVVVAELSFCARLKFAKRDRVLKSVLRKIVDANELNGFLVCNFILQKRNAEVVAKSQELLREASSCATVVKGDCSLADDRTFRRFMRNPVKDLVHYHVAATGKVYIIIILDSGWLLQNIDNPFEAIRFFNLHYSTRLSVTKTLVVTILDKPYKFYKRLLRKVPVKSFYFYNIDVLEIVIRRNRKRAAPRVQYRVIRFDFFKKNLRVTKYSRKTKFFPDKMKNLHGLKLTMRRYPNFNSNNNNDMYRQFGNLMIHYPFECVVKQLNGTPIFVGPKYNSFACHSINLNIRDDITTNTLISAKSLSICYVVPVLYDEVQGTDYRQIGFNLIALIAIIFIYQKLRDYLHFDTQTWQLTRIFSMIIGIANPRNPVRFGETVAFALLIAVGFFAGSDIIFGLFSANVVQKVERQLETVEDVIRNNISFGYSVIEEKERFEMIPNVNWFKIEKVHVFDNLLTYKNESVVSTSEYFSLPFPAKVMVNSKIHARRSNIHHSFSTYHVWLVARCCPWLQNMNYCLMRYYESFIEKTRETNRIQELLVRLEMKVPIEKLTLKLQEESEVKTEDIAGGLWSLIALGVVLPLFVLAIEVIFHKYSSASRLTLNDVRFHLSQIHLQSLHSCTRVCKK